MNREEWSDLFVRAFFVCFVCFVVFFLLLFIGNKALAWKPDHETHEKITKEIAEPKSDRITKSEPLNSVT